jgi:transposase
MDLTNEQWQRIAGYFPKPKAQPGKSGQSILRVILIAAAFVNSVVSGPVRLTVTLLVKEPLSS